MKSCSCNKTPEQIELQRVHYCGTCKTIGRMYGQKARVLLNYDAVFLGEMLYALQPQPAALAPAYGSRNCLSLPSRSQIPWALKYAATANVVLAQIKVLDQIADSGSKVYRLARWLYSREFRKAGLSLVAFQFPVKELYAVMSRQIDREKEATPTLERLAEPTADATRLVFSHGAIKAGADCATVDAMADLGFVFGKIAYLVDAMQDVEEDRKKGTFNALAATGTSRAQATCILREWQAAMLECLRSLPIDEATRMVFASRLRSNLAPILLGETQLNMARRSRIRTTSRGYDRQGARPSCCFCCEACACDCCSDCACDCCICEAASCCDVCSGC
ncbi:MAG: DUF5685 family protein [Fimbriimonas sp.]|nr:DUF5685 family protein [Fimbriimonas sp.]